MAESEDFDFKPVGERATFVGQQKCLDTVVFVHGLGGDCIGTWGNFPQLLASDPDLPRLDIFLWGYASGRFWREDKIETAGAQLMAELGIQFTRHQSLHLVGHSLGGVVILKGIVSEMIADRANMPPTSDVSFITLYASPVSGSGLASVVKLALGTFLSIVSTHIRQMARGQYMDDLMTQVFHKVYAPDQEGSSRRKIPIRMVMGSKDQIVDATDRQSASARFQRLQPYELPYNHRAIKEPVNHNDSRYRALSNDVQEGLAAARFNKICADIRGNDQALRVQAVTDFEICYEHIFRRRLEDLGFDTDSKDELYRSYLNVIVDYCLAHSVPPFHAADRALLHLITERKLSDQL